MRRDYTILAVFLGITIISGALIFVIQRSGTEMPEQSGNSQAEQSPLRPETGKIREHIGHLEEQLKKDPNNHDVLIDLGNGYYDLSEPSKAIEYYERALQIRPNNAGVMVDLGAMYRQNGDADKAIELFNKAIQVDPQLPQAYFNLGMVLRSEKNDAIGAAKAWKKYLELDPNSQAREFLQEQIEQAPGS